MRSSAAGTIGSLQRCNKRGTKARVHFRSGRPTRASFRTESLATSQSPARLFDTLRAEQPCVDDKPFVAPL